MPQKLKDILLQLKGEDDTGGISMDIQIKQGPQCHPSNCYTYRNDDILFIVIHFTGNNGDTALNNCNYFSGANRGASVNYFIGDDLYQSVQLINGRRGGRWYKYLQTQILS